MFSFLFLCVVVVEMDEGKLLSRRGRRSEREQLADFNVTSPRGSVLLEISSRPFPCSNARLPGVFSCYRLH